MSMKNAVTFYEKLQDDLELQKKIVEIGDNEKLEHLVRDELGYEFTKEEMQKVVFERNPELTDEELEAVVGGMSMEAALAIVVPSGIGAGLLGGGALFAVIAIASS